MHSFSYKHIDDLIDNFVDLKNYYSYFDKCCSSMLNAMLTSTQNATEQKQYINHLCTQIICKMNVNELIDYIDINRIRGLLY